MDEKKITIIGIAGGTGSGKKVKKRFCIRKTPTSPVFSFFLREQSAQIHRLFIATEEKRAYNKTVTE